MRLLSLVDLASDDSGKIPYASIKNTLQVSFFSTNNTLNVDNLFCVAFSDSSNLSGVQVNDEEVELWVVKAITAKLVACKMDQMNQVVIVRQVSNLLLFRFICVNPKSHILVLHICSCISRCAEREFGQKQWQSLRTKLAAWRVKYKTKI